MQVVIMGNSSNSRNTVFSNEVRSPFTICRLPYTSAAFFPWIPSQNRRLGTGSTYLRGAMWDGIPHLDIMDRAAPWNFMSYVSAFNYTEPCLGRTFGMPNSAKTCLDPSSYLCKQGLRPRHKIGFVELKTPHFVPC